MIAGWDGNDRAQLFAAIVHVVVIALAFIVHVIVHVIVTVAMVGVFLVLFIVHVIVHVIVIAQDFIVQGNGKVPLQYRLSCGIVASRMKILDVPQSGSYAGVTHAHNRFGQYRRTRAQPVKPATDKQTNAQTRLAMVSQAWRDLTAAQIAGWEALALQLPRVDSLGQTYHMTGAMLFTSVGSTQLVTGQALIETAPTLPVFSPFTLSYADPLDTANMGVLEAGLSLNDKVMLFASPPMSPGAAFCGDYRYMGVYTVATPKVNFDYKAAWQASWGVAIEGARIFVRCFQLVTGIKSAPVQITDIVAGP